jgi:IBR domain, a half RING-finger domain
MSRESGVFDCSICYGEYPYLNKKKKNQEIQCPQCLQQVCVTCQTMYAKGECMHCKMVWKVSFIVEKMGSTFYEKVMKPKKIEELLVAEKEKLPQLQPLVEWERKTRQDKENSRFGIPPSMIARPKISASKIQVFPCPTTGCRGFIQNGQSKKQCGTCSVCQKDACVRCLASLANTTVDAHVCKVEDIQSLLAIQQDSRQCPRCTSFIYRTEGCNHMYCTNCHTHFDWVSGSILKTSTNGHYLNLQKFSENIATLPTPDESTSPQKEDSTGCPTFSLTANKVDFEKMKEKGVGSERFLHSLYEDSNSIRLYKRKRLVEEEMKQEYQMKLEEYGIRYLMNEIMEVQWGKALFNQFKQYERAFLYADIFNLYLSTIDMLQEQLFTKGTEEGLDKQLRELLQLCNQSFESIQKEYGGGLIHFREYDEPLEHPSIQA